MKCCKCKRKEGIIRHKQKWYCERCVPMEYQVTHAKDKKWKVLPATCETIDGGPCWCAGIVTEDYIDDDKQIDPDVIVVFGAIHKEWAEYFVELHNAKIQLESKW